MSLNLALVISGDAKGARDAARDTTAAVQETGRAAKETSAAIAAANGQSVASSQRVVAVLTGQIAAQRQLQQSIQAMVARATPSDQAEFRQRSADIESYGRQLDGLRAKFNPVYAEIQRYRQAQAEVRQAHRLGAISSDEMAAAMRRERQAALDSIAAIRQRRTALSGLSGPSNFNPLAVGMIGQQAIDIGMMGAAGQSLGMLAIQQGPQLGLALEQSLGSGNGGKGALGAVKALGTGLMGLLTPMNLIGIGAAVAGGAIIQWFSKGDDEAKTLDDAMKKHLENVKALDKAYGIAGASSEKYFRNSAIAAEAQARESQRDLEKQLVEERERVVAQIGSRQNVGVPLEDAPWDKYANTKFVPSREFAAFGPELEAYVAGADRGVDKSKEFEAAVRKIGDRSPDLGKVAEKLITITKELNDGRYAADRMAAAIGRSLSIAERFDIIQGRGRARLEDDRIERQMEAHRTSWREQAEYAAQIQQMQARTGAERVAAARAMEAARGMGDMPVLRELREELAAKMELARIEQERAEATRDRNFQMAESVGQARLDLQLIGATAAEAERQRVEYNLMAELRERAARTGQEASQAEIDAIKRTAHELSRYAEAAAKANLQRDLFFDIEQLGRSPMDREIASQLRGAGLEVDFSSQEAGWLRYKQNLTEIVGLWQDVRKSGMDTMSSIFDLAFDGFDNWKQKLSDIASNVAKQIFDLGIKNPSLNAMYPGANLPTMDMAGGIGGFFKTFLGMTENPAARAVGAMNVQAATVMINGATIGGMAGLPGLPGAGGLPEMAGGWGGNIGRVFNPANANIGSSIDFKRAGFAAGKEDPAAAILGGLRYDNAAATRNQPLTESLAAKIKEAVGSVYGQGAYASVYSGGQGRIGTTSRRTGTTRHDLGHAGDLRIFDAKGDQITGDRLAPLGQYWQAKGWGGTGLEMRGGGIHLDEHAGRARNWWYSGKNAEQVKGIELGQQGIFPQLQTTATAASQALDKLAVKSVDAGDGLGGLLKTVFGGPGGVPSMPAMAGAFPPIPAAPAGAGGGGLLDMLFKTLFSFLPGFAGGTDDFPGGFARMNEGGRGEIVKFPRGSKIIPHDVSVKALSAANGNSSFAGKTEMHFHNAPAVERRDEQDDGAGGKRIDVWFSEQAAQEATRRGSPFNKALGGMGVRTRTKVR